MSTENEAILLNSSEDETNEKLPAAKAASKTPAKTFAKVSCNRMLILKYFW